MEARHVEALQVLIVEDEILIVMDLEDMIAAIVPAMIVAKTSVAAAKLALNSHFDFAFLDVDVTNGKTFDVARLLVKKGIAFAFVSGSRRHDLPVELQSVPFISKPYQLAHIKQAILSRDARPPIS
jgi:DNA-binding LytR/AlgR family response regulator